jgi:hypothetical protein
MWKSNDTISSDTMHLAERKAGNTFSKALQSFYPHYSIKRGKQRDPPPHITADSQDDFAGRLIQLNIKFDLFDSKGRHIKGKAISMALILVYFPCDNQRHDQFCALFGSMLSSINPNTQIVMVGDINARIGVRTCDKHKEVLGPYGIARSNI